MISQLNGKKRKQTFPPSNIVNGFVFTSTMSTNKVNGISLEVSREAHDENIYVIQLTCGRKQVPRYKKRILV
jgi:hypothetical protein